MKEPIKRLHMSPKQKECFANILGNVEYPIGDILNMGMKGLGHIDDINGLKKKLNFTKADEEQGVKDGKELHDKDGSNTMFGDLTELFNKGEKKYEI